MNIGDIFEVEIEKLLYEGVGLAHINNFAVFVQNACDGDLLKVKVLAYNSKFAKAEIVEIIVPSQYRLKDKFCALQNVCGGCQWGGIDYSHQLDVKRQIIKEALYKVLPDKVDVLPVIECEKQSEFRYKIQLPVAQTKNSKRFLIGYYKPQTHEIVDIKHCEIQPKFIDEIVAYIRENLKETKINAYDEKKHVGFLRHIIFRISQKTNEILLTFVINGDKINEDLNSFAQKIYKNFKNIVGVCVNFNTNKNNVILGKTTQNICGENFYIEHLSNKKYQISANSFFQTNPYIAEKILEVIKAQVKSDFISPVILDAYSGVSTFGIYLSDVVRKVICVESEKSSYLDAKSAVELNKISNIELVNDDATKTFAKFIKNNINFDVSIIDPPRKGSTKEALNDLAKMTKKTIFYISCNPQTLARDALVLKSNGFKISFVQGADMFPHSYHIETIARFDRQCQCF